MPLKILLLEDDQELGETLKALLEAEGYRVDWAKRGNEVLDLTFNNRYDLYVFDIGVPDMDGLELLEALRDADDETPAVFISARTDIASILKGFETGAYDYLKKPFFPEELLIRIRAKFSSRDDDAIAIGDFQYRPKERVLYRNDEPISLGEVQTSLLHLLINNMGRVVDKADLMDVLHHPSDAALRVAINKLKQTTGLPIRNIRGVGYTLEAR
ncbi:MAG: response regulator transcription factor [Epsilonproteobacteria bacterium]|nr:response regulator transcription factor [Campylobacterota bacterium]